MGPHKKRTDHWILGLTYVSYDDGYWERKQGMKWKNPSADEAEKVRKFLSNMNSTDLLCS